LKRGVERPVIFLTGSGDILASVQAMKGGAVDYFQKPVNVDEFLNAVKLAEQRDRIRLQKHEERELIGRRLASLWQVERRIVDLVVRGMRNKEIAARLGITLRTVKEYRGRAMRKLDVENVPELVRALDKASIQPAKQTKYKKIVIDHLYKAIAKVRSQHRHDSVRAQVRYVIEILKRDYGVSVPDSLQKTIARRIKDFNMGQ
jgi:DNA-binding CsgD family transcriptional regulator